MIISNKKIREFIDRNYEEIARSEWYDENFNGEEMDDIETEFFVNTYLFPVIQSNIQYDFGVDTGLEIEREDSLRDSMLEKAANGHPAPWAIYEFDKELMESVLQDDDACSKVLGILTEEFMTDHVGDKEIWKLLQMYASANEDYRMVIDAVLVYLCGYSVPTLVGMIRKGEKDG